MAERGLRSLPDGRTRSGGSPGFAARASGTIGRKKIGPEIVRFVAERRLSGLVNAFETVFDIATRWKRVGVAIDVRVHFERAIPCARLRIARRLEIVLGKRCHSPP